MTTSPNWNYIPTLPAQILRSMEINSRNFQSCLHLFFNAALDGNVTFGQISRVKFDESVPRTVKYKDGQITMK